MPQHTIGSGNRDTRKSASKWARDRHGRKRPRVDDSIRDKVAQNDCSVIVKWPAFQVGCHIMQQQALGHNTAWLPLGEVRNKWSGEPTASSPRRLSSWGASQAHDDAFEPG